MITLSKEVVLNKGINFIEDEHPAVAVIKAQLENIDYKIKVVHFYGPSEISRFRDEVCTKVYNTHPLLDEDDNAKENVTHNRIPEHCKYEGSADIKFGSFTKSSTYRKLHDGRVEGIQTKSSIPAIVPDNEVIVVVRKLYDATYNKEARTSTDSDITRSLCVYLPGGF